MNKKQINDLHSQIKTLPEGMFKGMPKNEIENFKKYKAIPIELLVKADWIYKQEDEFKSEKLLNNIKRNGQIENVHVRLLKTGFFEVVNGNHRLDEYNKAGIKFVWCFDHGEITVQAAQRIAIETNETKFESDTVKLAKLIKEIQSEFSKEDLLETMPYNETEFENFEKLLQFDWNQGQDNNNQNPNEGKRKIELLVSEETLGRYDVCKKAFQTLTGKKTDDEFVEVIISFINKHNKEFKD